MKNIISNVSIAQNLGKYRNYAIILYKNVDYNGTYFMHNISMGVNQNTPATARVFL